MSTGTGAVVGTEAPLGNTSRFWTWSLVGLAVWTMAVAWFLRLPCHQMKWSGNIPYQGACYSDLPTLYKSTGMIDGSFPYLSPDALLEYPVLQSLIATLTGVIAWAITPVTSVHVAQSIYFDVNVVTLAAAWVVTVLLLSRLVVAPRYAVVAALAPAVAATGVINWDLWPVLTTVAALLCFRRDRWILGGVFLGLGTALKLWPFLILGALIVLALRRREFGPLFRTALATALTWLAVNVPFMLLDPTQWGYFWSFSSERGAGFSSVYHVWNRALAPAFGMGELSPHTINLIAYGVFALCCVGVLVIGLLAPKAPTIEQLSLLIVAAFVVTNKVYSPQFVLWLVPLVILARPRIVEFLVWQVIEVFHWFAIFSWLYANGAQTPTLGMWTTVYVGAVLLHVVAVVAICGATVGDILRGRAPRDVAGEAANLSPEQASPGGLDSSAEGVRGRNRRQGEVTHG
ncbi:DUF2029 domain-containing protein [Kocuria sp. JC486]|nr:DUF2029 domain-containing protein [Kocuria sp. JC486]